jgi:GT2 family glycosyltransferase
MKTSVIMPVHGNWPVARRALDALEPELGGEREVIVVDDASPEPAPDGLPGTIVRNDENAGFGPSCNRGAELAQGRFVLFLNSDSIVEPGALAALEARAEREDAAVTGMLLGEDGRVQEAGCAVGRDGVTFPLGAGSEPDDPQWAFRREVDYGSAACLLVSRDRFRELGGFDDRFAPGYYEDVDFCLRLGRTILEPAARVVHLQHGSGSVERARELVRRNRTAFVERWGSRFAHRPIVVAARPWTHRLLALRDAIALLRILVVGDARLAEEAASRWPHARITLVGAEPADGVESAEASDLDARHFHYSAVLGEIDVRSQPQAARDLDDPILPPPGEEPRG